MAACGSLQHIFENPLPESTTLLETFSSWNQIKPAIQPIEQSSFNGIFGELHFKENSESSTSPSSSFPISPFSSAFKLSSDKDDDGSHENDENDASSSSPKIISIGNDCSKIKIESFPLKSSESLQLCTEGLGFESSDDVEDIKNEMKEEWQSINIPTRKHTRSESCPGEFRFRSRAASNNNVLGGAFPPPISCIGKSGKPWVCFKSYRQDGRFVLKQVRIPTQEFLHACREDGRLKLQLVQPNDETWKNLKNLKIK